MEADIQPNISNRFVVIKYRPINNSREKQIRRDLLSVVDLSKVKTACKSL